MGPNHANLINSVRPTPVRAPQPVLGTSICDTPSGKNRGNVFNGHEVPGWRNLISSTGRLIRDASLANSPNPNTSNEFKGLSRRIVQGVEQGNTDFSRCDSGCIHFHHLSIDHPACSLPAGETGKGTTGPRWLQDYLAQCAPTLIRTFESVGVPALFLAHLIVPPWPLKPLAFIPWRGIWVFRLRTPTGTYRHGFTFMRQFGHLATLYT
jgi:hypothetical protein